MKDIFNRTNVFFSFVLERKLKKEFDQIDGEFVAMTCLVYLINM